MCRGFPEKEANMQIGVCVHLDTIETLGEKLAAVRANGFTSCQLLAWSPEVWKEDNAAEMKAILDEYGVTPSAFWCGWIGPKVWNFTEGPMTLGIVPEAYRMKRTEDIIKGADFAVKIGVKRIATHVGFLPENIDDHRYCGVLATLRYIANECKNRGLCFLFETGQETPTTLLRVIEDIGLDNVGINLDTANPILYGKANPLDALDVFGKYVMDIHGKDGLYPTNGNSLGRETPIGEGKVNFPLFVSKLKEIGYTGTITIEREISGEQQIKDILMAKAVLEDLIG